ncbi:EF-hand domain-containing protein [Roseovarius sp. THAF9]|uniref:EF-hand domain-containing protein n=1 Tax=Roseovarius sp. THAF9 TaxID=2587847 RepID=UPI0015625E08|nr:EF-hand domain-containing protein [Roseovarius sp. THAF9]
MRFPVFLTLAASLVATPVLAQDGVDPIDVIGELSRRTVRQLAHDPREFAEHAIRQVFQVAADGRLTAAALGTTEGLNRARARARILGDFLELDLDGDLQIDAAEIARIEAHGNATARQTVVSARVTLDADGDGTLSTAEIVSAVSEKMESYRPHDTALRDILLFDMDGDGSVTPDEIGVAVRLLAQSPALARAARLPQAGAGKAMGACNMPTPSEAAEVVFVSGYAGDAVSNIALSGFDRVTTSAELEIEAGEGPVYVVATAWTPVIWEVTGAVDRVEAFVGNVHQSRAGVVGLNKQRVHLVTTKGCLPDYLKAADNAAQLGAQKLLERRLGRDVERVVSFYDMGRVAVPSGDHHLSPIPDPPEDGIYAQSGIYYRMTETGPEEIRGGPDDPTTALRARVRGELNRLYPGGVVAFAEGDVVTLGQARSYDVLPHGAGILQLIEAGALRGTKDRRILIAEPIARFPAGMSGSFRTTFLLGEGVPLPAGNPQQSEVWDAVTGRCILGALCPQ